ncbi:MAG: OmpH family outer membrane protein [Ghiorsea sp.]
MIKMEKGAKQEMKKTLLLIMLSLFCWTTSSVAAEMKIGYVDIKTAMENTKEYSKGIKRLEALQNKKKRTLEAKRNRVSQLDKELQMQSMAMSNAHQVSKQQEFTRLKKEFERELQDASDELKGAKRQLDQTLIGKFYDVVRAYGKAKKYDLILPKSTTIYGNSAYDVTADITKILDKK